MLAAAVIAALAVGNVLQDSSLDRARRSLNQGRLRISNYNSIYNTTGRLEIQLVTDEAATPPTTGWFSLCQDGWTQAETDVACRQMGLHTSVSGSVRASISTSAPSGWAGPGKMPTRWTNISCRDTIHRIADCDHAELVPGVSSCPVPNNDIWITCGRPLDWDVRLISIPNLVGDDRGVLEFFYNGSWGAVCDDGWRTVESTVVCSQLGFSRGHLARIGTGALTRVPIALDDVRCPSAPVPNLGACNHAPLGSHNCNGRERVGLICTRDDHSDIPPSDTMNEGALRLTGGTSSFSGRLEVQLVTNSTSTPPAAAWFKVCGDGWTAAETATACGQMGFHPGVRVAVPGLPVLVTGATNFTCNERRAAHRLLDCPHVQLSADNGIVRCDAAPVALRCGRPSDYDVRLHNVANLHGDSSGVLEFYSNTTGAWAAVCDDGWTPRESNVICQQLGFTTGGTLRRTSAANSVRGGVRPIALSNVRCPPTRSDGVAVAGLGQCYHSGLGNHYCNAGEMVGLQCFNSVDSRNHSLQNQGALRLSNGDQQFPSRGRLEMQLVTDGSTNPPTARWFKVCPNNWTPTDTRVACRQMGMYPGTMTTRPPADWSSGSGFVVGRTVTNFACRNHTHRLFDCPHDGEANQMIMDDTCTGTVYLTCTPATMYDARLVNVVGMTGDGEGVLEYYNSTTRQWGSICEQRWSAFDSITACKSMGFNSGYMVPTPNTAVHRAPITIGDVVCDRLDVHLRQCSHRPVWARHGCRDIGSDSQKVSLQCTYAENTTGGGPPTTSEPTTSAPTTSAAPGAYTGPPDVYPDTRDDDDDDGSGLNLAVAIAAGIAFVVMGLVYGYYRWTLSNSAPISAYAVVHNEVPGNVLNDDDSDDGMAGARGSLSLNEDDYMD